ncbi:MAG TPA: hypothetical protein VG675_06820 [Bryobacteraceae bacterium]|nr:hypothetical protein [Bryobacteraceae bacterium]
MPQTVRHLLLLFGSACCLLQAAPQIPRIALFGPTADPRSHARVEAMLSEIAGPPAPLELRDDWSSYSLVVLVSPTIPDAKHGRELTFTQKLATYYFRGGHVLIVGLPGEGAAPQTPDEQIWDKLARYFWAADLHSADGPLDDSDHRAYFVPGAEVLGTQQQFQETVRNLLAARDDLPEQLPAENFGPVTDVAVRGNSLLINGKPQLLKSIGFYELLDWVPMRDHEEVLKTFHQLGFNSAAVIVHYDVTESHLRQFLNIARQNGIYLQVQVQGPVDSDEPVRKEYLLNVLRFRNHPALIGWEMCDDMWDVYYPYIEKAVSIIRRYDQRLPITGTGMDDRVPDRVQDWSKWKRLMDFPLDYIYPMQRDLPTLGYRGEIQGGLKDIELLADRTRKVWGNLFMEQFLQAHMQGAFAEKVGLQKWTEHLLPGADQERLITYRALLAGVKGLVFFYPRSLEDEGMGRGRRNELALVWRELAPVEDILAAGDPPEPLTTSDKTVDARIIRSGKEAVILAAKDQVHYNRYVDDARVDRLTVQLPADSSDCPVYQLAGPSPEKRDVRQTGGAKEIALRPFTLSTALLYSCDAARQRRVEETMQSGLPDEARYAIEVLGDEQVKTEVVRRHLPSELQGSAAAFQNLTQALDAARQAAAASDWTSAWRQAADGLTYSEEYRAEAMQAAVVDADRRQAGKEARAYLNLYFSLPNYAYVTRGGPRVAPGQLRQEILEAEHEPVWNSIDRVVH